MVGFNSSHCDRTAILLEVPRGCSDLALTPSTMLPLGSSLPVFALPSVHDLHGSFSSADLDQRPALLMVLCAHCPFVKHVEPELSRLEQDYGSRIQMIGISSNSLITHPQDGPKQLAEQAERQGWRFPYLLDDQHSLAKALRAACTPEFYLFNPNPNGHQTLHYRGQLDSSRPGNEHILNGQDLRAALDAVLNGTAVNPDQTPSVGCNVKWNPGQEPDWFG